MTLGACQAGRRGRRSRERFGGFGKSGWSARPARESGVLEERLVEVNVYFTTMVEYAVR